MEKTSKTITTPEQVATILVKAQQWWKDNMKSSLETVVLKKDGYLRFEWSDKDESGSYHLSVASLEDMSREPLTTNEGWFNHLKEGIAFVIMIQIVQFALLAVILAEIVHVKN